MIFHFLLRNKYNGLLNLLPPLKSTAPLGAIITRADSTLKMAPPPLFSRSGFSIQIGQYFVLFKNVLNVNKVSKKPDLDSSLHLAIINALAYHLLGKRV